MNLKFSGNDGRMTDSCTLLQFSGNFENALTSSSTWGNKIAKMSNKLPDEELQSVLLQLGSISFCIQYFSLIFEQVSPSTRYQPGLFQSGALIDPDPALIRINFIQINLHLKNCYLRMNLGIIISPLFALQPLGNGSLCMLASFFHFA